MEFDEGCLEGRMVTGTSAVWKFESLSIDCESVDLNTVDRFTARLRTLVLPREVMGYGDVKFLAAIGAFTGWKAVFFTLMAGSCAGALFGMFALLLGRREWSGKIPFGPYLAFGALLWLAVGEEAWRAYWSLFAAAPA
jgi:leader peptidase (prepilin peptidase)/N-methyltransferase